MDEGEREYIKSNVLKRQMCGDPGLRCIMYAYHDYHIDVFQRMARDWNNFKSEEERDILVNDLTFVGIFGLDDPLRKSVEASVMFAKLGKICIRMISGDHLETAKAVALKAEIITPEELKNQHCCMHSKDFRKQIGKIIEVEDDEGNLVQAIENMDRFKLIIEKLRVLGRATPEDKLAITIGLQQLGQKVAVTGDGCNDADALRTADVGIAMGQAGCEVAKEASDIILTRDNFGNVLVATMWGRNIYENVKKFLQFQITVNLSCTAIIVLTACVYGQSPFSTFQLLYINLLMDAFGALALASEPPHPTIMKSEAARTDSSIITPMLWRQIFGIAIYEFFVLMLLLFSAPASFGFDINFHDNTYEDGLPTGKGRLYTIMFQTFVFMNLFNEMNCRKIKTAEANPFVNFFNNPFFLAIFFGTIGIQIVMNDLIPRLAGVVQLTTPEFMACVILGSTVLIVSPLLKLITKKEWLIKLENIVDETQDAENDPFVKGLKDQTSARPTEKKAQAASQP